MPHPNYPNADANVQRSISGASAALRYAHNEPPKSAIPIQEPTRDSQIVRSIDHMDDRISELTDLMDALLSRLEPMVLRPPADKTAACHGESMGAEEGYCCLSRQIHGRASRIGGLALTLRDILDRLEV